jgi:hypothetical protein
VLRATFQIHRHPAIILLSLSLLFAGEPQIQAGIAFFAEHEGGLHILDPESGTINNVDIGLWNVGNLAYSSPARLLAFEASKLHDDRPRSLYLLKHESVNPTLIFQSDLDTSLYRPEFDPAGEYLYAVNYSSGIHRFSLADSQWTAVPVEGISELNTQRITFSPSGQQVAISPGRFEGFLIGRMTSTGIVIERHILQGYRGCYTPRWINEDRIVFSGQMGSGDGQLWSMDLRSDEVVQLTTSPIATRSFLALSADRTVIVFTATNRHKPLEWRLWRVNVDGTDLQQLTQGGHLSSHLSPVCIEW